MSPAPSSSSSSSTSSSSSSTAATAAAATAASAVTAPPSFPLSRFRVGDRVQVDSVEHGAKGTLRYVGVLHAQPNGPTFAGIEWDEVGTGKNSGELQGRAYFTCAPLTGSFLRPERLWPSTTLEHALYDKYDLLDATGLDALSLTAERHPSQQPSARSSGTNSNNSNGDASKTTTTYDVSIRFVGLDKTRELIRRCTAQLAEISCVSAQIERMGDLHAVHALIPSCTSLDLSNNLLRDWRELDALVPALPALRALTLSRNALQRVDVDDVERADRASPSSPFVPRSFSSLRVLVLNQVPHAWTTVLAFSRARLFGALEELHLSNCGIASLDVPASCCASSSSSLPASSSASPSPSMIAAFFATSWPQLRVLDLSHNALSSWTHVCHFAALPRLDCLYVHHNQLPTVFYPCESSSSSSSSNNNNIKDDDGSDTFVPFAHLRILSLSDNRLSSFADIDALGEFPALIDLRIQRNPFALPTLSSESPVASANNNSGDNAAAGASSDHRTNGVAARDWSDAVDASPPSSSSTVFASVTRTRLVIIARLPKLQSLNASKIPARDRQDAEKIYVSEAIVFCQQCLREELTRAAAAVAAAASSRAELIERLQARVGLAFSRFAALAPTYDVSIAGVVDEAQLPSSAGSSSSAAMSAAGASSSSSMSASLVSVRFRHVDASSGKVLNESVKRIQASMKVSVLRQTCERMFKVMPHEKSKHSMWFQASESSPAEPMNDMMKIFSFYPAVENCLVDLRRQA